MPKLVTERQYLVPMYQHVVVEAETYEAACELAVSDAFPGKPRRWIATMHG